MCNKAQYVKRVYTLVMTSPVSAIHIETKCIGVFKNVCDANTAKESTKKYTDHLNRKLHVVTVDIPISILY